MRFCQDHWDALRERIEARGLSHLIASSGVVVAEQMADQVAQEEITPVNFDPLMDAHWAIVGNVMQTVSNAGGSPLYLMGSGDEDPVEGYEGRTWPRCPLCYLNLAHEITCRDPGCTLDQQRGYDWMLDRASDDARAKAVDLELVEESKS